jgi:hypothetical protein
MVTEIIESGAQTIPVATKMRKNWRYMVINVLDEYYWMNDYWLKGPDSSKVVDYLNQENGYFQQVMAPQNRCRIRFTTKLKIELNNRTSLYRIIKMATGILPKQKVVRSIQYMFVKRNNSSSGRIIT